VLLAAADTLANATCVIITGAGSQSPLQQAALAAPDPAVTVLVVPDGATLPDSHPAHGKPAWNQRLSSARGMSAPFLSPLRTL
jgi:hypothetical protein